MGRCLFTKILLLSAAVVSQESLDLSSSDSSETQPPYWKTDICKNIYPSQCAETEETMARRCGGVRQFVPRVDPENICCPKYGCICNGIEDANGVFQGSTEKVIDKMRYHFGNCTVIRGSVVIEIPSGQDPYEMNEILKQIEEIWGFLSVEADHVTELRFENLRIIKGLHTKKKDTYKKLFQNTPPFQIATSLYLQMPSLKILTFPKLKEITRGNVMINGGDKKLCLPLTVDYYGELFAHPCSKEVELQLNKTESECQDIYFYDICNEYFDNRYFPPYKKNRKKLFEMEAKNFEEIRYAKKCNYCQDEYQNRIQTLGGSSGDAAKLKKRCWHSDTCQILSKTVCTGPISRFCGGPNSIFMKTTRRCNLGLLSQSGKEFDWAPKNEFDECCPNSCSGGCDSFQSRVPSIERPGRLIDQIWTTCSSCKNDNDKKIYKNTFFLERCLPTCMHSFRVPLMFVESNGESSTKKFEGEYCRESSQCKNRLVHDIEDSNCVRYCGKRFGKYNSIEYEALVAQNMTNPRCRRCDVAQPLTLKNSTIDYGYNCTSGHFPEAPVVCWGMDHPKWKNMMTGLDLEVDNMVPFFEKHHEDFSKCNIIDGDLRIHQGHKANESMEWKLCNAFRNVKFITGHLFIANWPMETLGCLENLKVISGKSDTRESQTFDETDQMGFILKKREDGTENMKNSLKYIGKNFSVMAGISIQFAPANKNVVICNTQEENLENFVIGQGDEKPVVKLHVSYDKQHEDIYNIKDHDDEIKAKIDEILEDQCGNKNACHSECLNGCFGPSESDCRSCKNFLDKTIEIPYEDGLGPETQNSGEIQGANTTDAFYNLDEYFQASMIHEAEVENTPESNRSKTFKGPRVENYRNLLRPRCVEKCPRELRFANEATKECLPCDKECHPEHGCKGLMDTDCDQCRNFRVNYEKASTNSENEAVCDCSFEVSEKNNQEITFKGKGNKCKEKLKDLDLNNEEERGNKTVIEFLNKKGCGDSNGGIVIKNDNGKIKFVTCWEDDLPVGAQISIYVSVALVFMSIASVFIYRNYSSRLLKRGKTKDAMRLFHSQPNDLLPESGGGPDQRRFHPVTRFSHNDLIFGEQLGEGHFGLVFEATLRIRVMRDVKPRNSSSTSNPRTGSSSDVPLVPRREEIIVDIPVAAKQIKPKVRPIRDILWLCSEKDLFTEENQKERILKKLKEYGSDRLSISGLDQKSVVDPDFLYELQTLEARVNEKELFDETANFHFLRHEHLVKVHGISEHHADPSRRLQITSPSMVLEFALKGALDKYVHKMMFKQKNKLDERYTIQWFYQISDAMQYLHENNVFHRDLAARNILLTDDLKALVGDFGLAALAPKSAKSGEEFTMDKKQIPCLWYPFESLRNDTMEKVFSSKGDVYSFGMLMWEVLSGCPPGRPMFFGNRILNKDGSYNEQAHINLLRDEEMPSTPICRPSPKEEYYTCTNDFYNDFMKPCWSKEPSNRPDFAILKKKFDGIRGKAKDYILLDKQEGKKLSRSSASTLRTLEKQHSQLSTSPLAAESPSLDSPIRLTETQIHATRNFDPLNANYSFVSRNQPVYENQESPMRPVQPPSMPSNFRGQTSAFQFPMNRQPRNSDNGQSTTSATNLHYTGGSFDSPTRTVQNRLYSNATQLTNLTNSIPETSSQYQNVNDDVFSNPNNESRALLEEDEQYDAYQNAAPSSDVYLVPRS
ncbi:Oidioi.mRNA.OKI2018_I69.PAR.g9359.t2.cds [Oikopleura dioica]|uniref:Oidioi.mRNA.OKI2018_I69.PAR.g9359.t2.cds n=1 Tax=Oikopleura dioica TaxID=34765 RepID=A0ABN7RPN1_OIKDI|nr:Oidioi.mRNA.OKI2018_I69.PAR.g9359.t2.cds [Oikopleura dioica]